MEFTKDNMKAVLAQDLMAVEANLNEEFASDASDFNALVAPLSAAASAYGLNWSSSSPTQVMGLN